MTSVEQQTPSAPPAQDSGARTPMPAGPRRELAPAQTPARSHGDVVRGLQKVPESRLAQGRFGRMFRTLPPLSLSEAAVRAIAVRMAEGDTSGTTQDNPDIPAGYTYLGQFLDHDLTFDPASSLERQNDPDALTNFRTPRFDLDSVYGRGPADQPYLYSDTKPDLFLIDKRDDLQDLPRNSQGRALIGDPRNDENVFVSQVHLTMLRFHNRVVRRLGEFPSAAPRPGESTFTAAQRVVRWHYQWVLVHDFLRRVVGQELLDSVLVREPLVPGGAPVEQVRRRFFSWKNEPFMPVEFSVAAYRFGHSMVRAEYDLNTTVTDLPIFPKEAIRKADPLSHLGGFRPLPASWQVEWRRFFDVGKRAKELQLSRVINTKIAPPLLDLPPEVASGISSLAERNLLRGVRLGLPSGQDVARGMGLRPLDDDDLNLPEPGPAPLWWYVLREAKVLGKGRHLGPVGGRIVAEVFLGVLEADPSSYLKAEPGWKPFLPAATKGDFAMGDLISFADFGLATV